MEVYILGIPETGGCWFAASSDCYLKYSDAEAALKRDRDKGIKYTRIFTIHPK